MKKGKKFTCLNHGGGHVVLAPTVCAADGASLAACLGLKFEKAVRIRVTMSDAVAPDPENWKFRPVSASVVSAWAGDIQLHLGSTIAIRLGVPVCIHRHRYLDQVSSEYLHDEETDVSVYN